MRRMKEDATYLFLSNWEVRGKQDLTDYISLPAKLVKLLEGKLRDHTLCWDTPIYQKMSRPGVLDTIGIFVTVSLSSGKLDQLVRRTPRNVASLKSFYADDRDLAGRILR